MKKKKLKIPLYGFRFEVIQTDNLKKVSEKFNLSNCEGCDAITFRIYNTNGSARYYIAVEGKTKPGIIAHEALHLVGLIYEDIHAILEIENDEPQCYLLGWIVEKCHKHLKIKK